MAPDQHVIPFERLTAAAPGSPPGDAVARILIAGDLSWSDVPDPVDEPAGWFPWEGLSETFSRHDLRVVNLESPLTDAGRPIVKSGPHLHGDPRRAQATKDGGFDVVGLANNHILDMGETGLADTLAACRRAGLRTVGAGEDAAAARRPLILDVKGITVGLLAYCEHEFTFAGERSAGAAPFDPIESARDLEALGEVCDVRIVLLHAGAERHDLPSPRVVRWCRWLVERGAGAVVCSHTHVPSGVETYGGAPIAYGAGNFLFTSRRRQDVGWYCGSLVRLELGTAGVTRAELIPYWQCRSSLRVEGMGAADGAVFEDHLRGLCEVIGRPEELQQLWLSFCRSLRPQYLRYALGLDHKEQRRVRERGVWPTWRVPRERIADLLNVYRCETHLDVMTALLEEELERDTAGSGPT